MNIRNTSLYVTLFAGLFYLYMVFAFSEPCKHQQTLPTHSRTFIVTAPQRTPRCFHWWDLLHDEPHDHTEHNHLSFLEVIQGRKRKRYRFHSV